jgi:hypothetical protein
MAGRDDLTSEAMVGTGRLPSNGDDLPATAPAEPRASGDIGDSGGNGGGTGIPGSPVDEFLTDYIVGVGLCLNESVADRILYGSTAEVCVGTACPQRRLCLSRTLRRHLGDLPGEPRLRPIFDAALLELGNVP